ncbi:reprolysin-like metallopeptidase [Trujillonella endophytica]|uniref:reprolysin-like metallopeptidase n=1 Tax=Trujillonella endophytica TaxID=673521 RepID=UPI001113C5F7|nr:hypothetical protein [Trujillella endophytica]
MPPARAEEETPATGDTVVGELVQGYADAGPDAEEPVPPAEEDAGLLSWIRTAPGEAVRVPTEDLGATEAGATVEVALGDAVVDEATEQGLEPAYEVLAAEVVAPPEATVPAPAADPADHPVTVVMVQPADAAAQRAADPTTLAQVVAAVDGPVADFWLTQSAGAVRFAVAGTVASWVVSDATCRDPWGLWEDAATAASTVGWTGAPAEHLLVYVPRNSPNCSYGVGTVGRALGEGGLAYVRDTATSVIAHELGHNLGLGHSSLRQCDAVTESADASCQVRPYYDLYDVMGASWTQVGSLNVTQAANLGLLPSSSVRSVGPTTGGTVVLSAVSGGTGTRAVRLAMPDGRDYWVEYRPAGGRDAWLATAQNQFGLQPGVLVRRSTAGSDSSVLLDGSPSRASGWGGDLEQAVPPGTGVLIGGTYRVTVESIGAGGATVRVEPPSEIALVHQRTGGNAGLLGPPLRAEQCGIRDGGCFQEFRSGVVYWSPATGAHFVVGLVWQRWAAQGWEWGGLGFPVGDTTCGLRDGGCFQHFQGGSVFFSPATGARVVAGVIRDRWAATGWENGLLGYPTADPVCGIRDGGCLQEFRSGVVYWSPATGAHFVVGLVRGRWAAQGWEWGRLGFPVGDTTCGLRDGGCFQHFQGGSVYWSPASGARVAWGAIRDTWSGYGWEAGRLGYPLTEEICGLRDGGCFQAFQGGSVYWSPATGAVPVWGAIRDAWAGQGWEHGRLGYPVSGESCWHGCQQRFQGGSIEWTVARGARTFLSG